MSKIYFSGVLALAICTTFPLETAQATSLTLYSDSSAYNQNDGTTFVSNPQTLVINGPTGTGSVSSQTSLTGLTAGQTVTGSLNPTGGTIRFQDGWASTNLALGQVAFRSPASVYDFTLAGPATLNMDWTASFNTAGGNLPMFGLYDIATTINGNPIAPGPDLSGGWVTPGTAGHGSISLGAGSHSLAFVDNANIFGGLGTQTNYIDESLTFSFGNISPVPLPPGLPMFAAALLALGGYGAARRRKTVA